MVSCFRHFLKRNRFGFINYKSCRKKKTFGWWLVSNFWSKPYFALFGFYAISFWKDPSKRFKLKIFDHAAIYVLIAGSDPFYTGKFKWWDWLVYIFYRLDFGIYRNYFKTIFYREIQGAFYRNVCFNGLAYYFLFQRINCKSTFWRCFLFDFRRCFLHHWCSLYSIKKR